MHRNFVRELLSEFVLPLMCISTVFAFAAFWPFDFSTSLNSSPASTAVPSGDTPEARIVSPATVLDAVPELPAVVPEPRAGSDGVREASDELLNGVAAIKAENS